MLVDVVEVEWVVDVVEVMQFCYVVFMVVVCDDFVDYGVSLFISIMVVI